MSMLRVIVVSGLAALVLQAADVPPGNAQKGKELFQSEQCIQCHSVNGQGGKLAPDLTRRIDRDYTPTVMASLMWNHAPDMWAAMKQQGIVKAQLSPSSAADLFAYFVAARYFEKPGDAGRGKAAFASKHCADCHGITESKFDGAPPVVKWDSLADPVVLAQQMWDHGSKMREAFAQKKLEWSQLTGQELTDILVYLQNLPETRNLAKQFEFPASDNAGAELFQSKGCAGCHSGRLALETRLRNQTMTDIAADMWNHEPRMKNPPPQLTEKEMRQILGYIWARQYFTGSGDVERGKKVFAEKSCGSCHGNAAGGAPQLAGKKGEYSDITVVSALWEHGPRMLERMHEQNLAWPRFTAQQMSDLIAYLNSL
jgi:mono/diheme cytochrome c family protein